jgi:hypothetical protein
MSKKRGSLISGVSIDEHGKIIGTLNLVSYMKLAPKGFGP